MGLDTFKFDIGKSSKNGIHFIIASIIIWFGILVIWLLPISNILTKNLLTFYVAAHLLPLSYIISKIVKSNFSSKDNPLNKLGVLLSCNQILYILIAMWVYPTIPDKMVMILAMIFGAHLLPFSWLYKSKAYFIMSILITISIFVIGVMFNPIVVSQVMILFQIVFSLWLALEVKLLYSN